MVSRESRRSISGPLGARIPHLRGFVQSHRLIVAGDKYRPDYDGMVELWFDDREALMAARQSPEWRVSSESEANFIDHSKVALLLSRRSTSSWARRSKITVIKVSRWFDRSETRRAFER
jgi:uncharacterized protein (TIGR02118 family)